MISPEEFALLNQNAHQFYASQAGVKPAGKKKNPLSAFISEAGGTGGALAGAAAGTALLPGVGTLLGGALGGFLGATGGKAAEQKIRDNQNFFGDGGSAKSALTEGAISGVMGAGPLRAGKALGSGVKALATKSTLEEAIAAAGEKYAGKGLVSGAGDMANNAADRLTTKSFRFTPTQITNFKDTHKEDVLDTIKRYKIKKPEDIETNAIQPLMQGFDDAVGAIGDVPKKDVLTKLKDAYTSLIGDAVDDNTVIGKQLKAQANTINKKYGATIPATEVNTLRKQFDNIVNYTSKAMNPARHDVNKRTADALRSTLQEAADRQGLRNASGMSLKEVGAELNKAIDLSKIANKQTGLGRGAQTLRLTDMLGAGAGGAVGAGPVGAIAGAGISHAINSPGGTRALASIAGGLGKAQTAVGGVLDGLGASPLGAAGRTLGSGAFMGAAAGLNGQSQPGTLEDAMMGAQPAGMGGGAGSYGQGGMAGPTQNTYTPNQQAAATAESSPYSKQNLIADMKRDPAHAKEYITYYKELADIYAPPKADTSSSYTKPTASQMAQATSANASIDDLFSKASANPGLVGKSAIPGQSLPIVGGLISRAAGTGAYNSEAASILNAVARINTGANMPASEEAFYRTNYLPQPGDSEATLRQKYQTLQSFLSPILNYQATSSGNTDDLASALLAAQ